MAAKKLCVCGTSTIFPLCDGSHDSEGWACDAASRPSALVFAASACFENLARKLAADLGGEVCQPDEPMPVADRLVLLVEAGDLAFPLGVLRGAKVQEVLVVSFGAPASLMATALAGGNRALQIIELPAEDALQGLRKVREVLGRTTPRRVVAPAPARSLFLSHAVADERALVGVTRLLRDSYGAPVFLCADSILAGSDWRAAIDEGLRRSDVFVLLLSSAAVASTFCAFEAGVAIGLGRTVHLISLDGAVPPPFLQHQQMVDIPRMVSQRPWLGAEDVLLEALLDLMV